MEQKIWLDHTVYRVYRNDDGYWEAAILSPKSCKPSTFSGEETSQDTVAHVQADYGESVERLPNGKFQEELDRRTVHSPEMLATLSTESIYNWTGRDLSQSVVYASVLRPVGDLRIDGTVGINAREGTKYGHWTVYGYIVSPVALDARTIEHYDLVFISHPAC